MSLAGMFLWRCPEFTVERHGRYFERTIRDNHRVSGDAASKGYICKLTGNTKGMCRGTCLFLAAKYQQFDNIRETDV